MNMRHQRNLPKAPGKYLDACATQLFMCSNNLSILGVMCAELYAGLATTLQSNARARKQKLAGERKHHVYCLYLARLFIWYAPEHMCTSVAPGAVAGTAVMREW
jgi:hypothetical protein